MSNKVHIYTTRNEIPKNQKNEWGYPLSPTYNKSRTKILKGGWRFMGFIQDQSRFLFLKKGDHDESVYEG
jgi:hypothetical protein